MRGGMGRAAMHGCGGDDEEQPKTAAAGTLMGIAAIHGCYGDSFIWVWWGGACDRTNRR